MKYNKEISLTDIAKDAYLGTKYFSRIFKEKTGRSFNEYRIGLRIEAAKQSLKENNSSIEGIAYRVGYKNPDSFMKMFKKTTGMTPSEYRQSKRAR